MGLKKPKKQCLFNGSSRYLWQQCRVSEVLVSKMAKIAFILLCHKDPDGIINQATRLTAVGDYISIHFDARQA